MTPKDALRKMVKAYPGSYESMAPRVGKTPEVLRKELSDSQTFKLGLETAQLISEICIEAKSPDCHAYVTAVAADSGALLRLPVVDMGPTSLPETVSGVMRELSGVTAETMQAMDDGVVSQNELARIEAAALEAVASVQRLIAACRANSHASQRGDA